MVPDLWSSRGESTTSKVGFILGTCRRDWLEERSKRLD